MKLKNIIRFNKSKKNKIKNKKNLKIKNKYKKL